MTKFESIGVARQYEATSINQAKKEFARSCDFCCTRGIHLECLGCSISFTHNLVMDYFAKRKY